MLTLTRFAALSLLSAALVVGPPVLFSGEADIAYANNGNGNGNGGGNGNGNGNGNGRGDRADRDERGNGNANRGNGNGNRGQRILRDNGSEHADLHPRELGRWNASNANQAALDAHIRNQNFNGTIGALAQYQLATRAANGEELTEDEQAALDFLIEEGGVEVEVPDEDIAAELNGDGSGDYVFQVTDGAVSCAEGCDDLTDEELDELLAGAQQDADDFVSETQSEEQLAALYEASEARIIEGAPPRHTEENDEPLLDTVAGNIGVVRQQVADDLEEAGAELRGDLNEVGAAIRGLFRN